MSTNNSPCIGIVFNPVSPDPYIWGYDVTRYCAQLIKLLNQLNYSIKLITPNADDNLEVFDNSEFAHFGINDYLGNPQSLDLVLEFPTGIQHRLLKNLKDKSAAKLIAVRYGNIQLSDMSGLFIKQQFDTDIHHQMADCVWLVGELKDCAQYLQYLYHAPVEIVPLLWAPQQEITPPIPRPNNIPNLVVIEKNHSVVSNILGAATIVHGVAAADKDMFGAALFFNSEGISDHPYFLQNILNNLYYLQSTENKAWFLSGIGSPNEAFSHQDIVIGYQHFNAINLYYLEAIARNIPIVHNCPLLMEVGYFYPEFDFKAGLHKAIRAINNHGIEKEESHNQNFLKHFSFNHKDNQQHYQTLINKQVN